MKIRCILVFFAASLALFVACGSVIRDSLGARTIGYTEGGDEIVPVEYLESTGSEWIDTGVNPGLDFSIEVEGMHVGNYQKNAVLFSNEGGAAFVDIIFYNYNMWQCRCYGGVSYAGETAGEFFYAKVDFNYSAATRAYFNLNGQTSSRATSKTEEQIVGSTKPIWLFYGPGGKTNPVRIAMFRMWKDGELAIDLVPVRIGSEGMMLDRVSGQLFRNQGTGAFLVGPDLN